jgi:hypothetical protein
MTVFSVPKSTPTTRRQGISIFIHQEIEAGERRGGRREDDAPLILAAAEDGDEDERRVRWCRENRENRVVE